MTTTHTSTDDGTDSSQPLWRPSAERIAQSNMTAFRQFVETPSNSLNDYAALHRWSVNETATFWQAISDFHQIKFQTPASSAYDPTPSEFDKRWFPNATFNFAEQLLNKGEDDAVAIIGTDELQRRRSITYGELRQNVYALARYLQQHGLKPGDRVAAYLPNTIETVIAMLASTYIGAVWSSCSPDFGTRAALDRFGQIDPKVLFYSDGYYYNGKAIDLKERTDTLKHSLNSLTLSLEIPFLTAVNPVQFPIPESSTAEASSKVEPSHQPFNHPLYILYSSGTTGQPKCIVHGAGGTLLQHIKELSLHVDLKPNERLFYYSTCGWMMWNWSVSSLALGATLVLFDGSPFAPHQEHLLDLIDNESIAHFGASAKYYAELEKRNIVAHGSNSTQKDNGGIRDLSSLKTLLSTGSPLNPQQFHFLYDAFKPDLCLASISGGTDIVSCFVLGNPTLPVWAGEIQCAGLGMDVDVFNDSGQPIEAQKGELICHTPFPSMPLYFWNDGDGSKYHKAYFAKYGPENGANIWAHGDYAEKRPNGGFIIYGRSDATLNPGGVRIGTAEIYRQVETIEEVLESIAVGQQYNGDVRVVLFVKLRSNSELTSELQDRIRKTIRQGATPRHVPAKIIQVPDIPRTVSGKIVELAVRNLIHGDSVTNRDSLANPESLDFYSNIAELQEE